jgi:DNA-binding GntR family transcriptional regulator
MNQHNQANGTAHHGSRRSRLVREILSDLFTGAFEPGQRMRVEHLGERYGVSATPVREALVELAGMGIVELQPNRGAVLRPFGPRQLQEIYQVRLILESEAARGVCGRIAPFELQELERELARLVKAPKDRIWSDQTRDMDTRLHDLISERCGNERLAHEIARYRNLYRSLRDVRHSRRESRADYAQLNENSEHLAIVRALISGDGDQAAQAMRQHIEYATTALQQELFDAETIAVSSKEPFLAPPSTVAIS